MCVYVCACVCMCVHVCVCMCVHVCVCVCVCVCVGGMTQLAVKQRSSNFGHNCSGEFTFPSFTTPHSEPQLKSYRVLIDSETAN